MLSYVQVVTSCRVQPFSHKIAYIYVPPNAIWNASVTMSKSHLSTQTVNASVRTCFSQQVSRHSPPDTSPQMRVRVRVRGKCLGGEWWMGLSLLIS